MREEPMIEARTIEWPRAQLPCSGELLRKGAQERDLKGETPTQLGLISHWGYRLQDLIRMQAQQMGKKGERKRKRQQPRRMNEI